MSGTTFLTVEEFSAQVGAHPETIRRYIREGKISAKKVFKTWRINPKEVKKFI